MVLVGFFHCFAIANHDEVISNKLDSCKLINKLMHLSLKHLWGRTEWVLKVVRNNDSGLVSHARNHFAQIQLSIYFDTKKTGCDDLYGGNGYCNSHTRWKGYVMTRMEFLK